MVGGIRRKKKNEGMGKPVVGRRNRRHKRKEGVAEGSRVDEDE